MLDKADRDARASQRFDRLDTDRNGAISRDEFAARGERGGPDARTADGAGTEKKRGGRGHRGGMMMLRMADADNDGSVTRAEFDAAVKAHFAEVDTDSDGSITKEERDAAKQKMREMRRDRAASGAAQ